MMVCPADGSVGQVAQLVEHRTENPGVGGSIPPLSTAFSILNIAEIRLSVYGPMCGRAAFCGGVFRHAGIGLYHAGRKRWVSDPDSALDLSAIEQATELSRDESLEEMDVVVTYDDPSCELVLPLRRKKVAEAEPLRAAA